MNTHQHLEQHPEGGNPVALRVGVGVAEEVETVERVVSTMAFARVRGRAMENIQRAAGLEGDTRNTSVEQMRKMDDGARRPLANWNHANVNVKTATVVDGHGEVGFGCLSSNRDARRNRATIDRPIRVHVRRRRDAGTSERCKQNGRRRSTNGRRHVGSRN